MCVNNSRLPRLAYGSSCPERIFWHVQMAQQAKQVLMACERTPTDEVELNYDPRNPFDTCPMTFTPIYRYPSPPSPASHCYGHDHWSAADLFISPWEILSSAVVFCEQWRLSGQNPGCA